MAGFPLPQKFYDRDPLLVARELLGCQLVHIDNGKRIAGIITETEAYCGEEDLACHAKAGLTTRTKPMYGPPGYAYVYFTYGMHWLFNVVTEEEGTPSAVLVRAVEPINGLEVIKNRRGKQPRRYWTDGPAKITQAFGIGPEHNEVDLTNPDSLLYIEKGIIVPDKFVTTSPRIGLFTVPEPWKSKPWRFLAEIPTDKLQSIIGG